MREKKSSNSRFIMTINVAIASIIVLGLVVILHCPDEPSETAPERAAAAVTTVETVEVHGSTPVAVVPVATSCDDGVFGGAEFQANVHAHLAKQSVTLLEEMDSAIYSGRTNDSLALTPEQLRDLETSGNMIY